MNSVRFSYVDVGYLTLKNKSFLKEFIATIFTIESKNLYVVNYIFCSDTFLLQINIAYLKHNFYTDIITFDLSSSLNNIIGEIYISTERVKENSKSYDTIYSDELLRVVFHGALHLCGYKDKRKSEITIMREKEEHYLTLYKEKYLACFT